MFDLSEKQPEDKKPEENKVEEKKEQEKKEHPTLRLEIDLDELVSHTPTTKIPECQQVWKSREDMSKEYIELHHVLQILALYIARNINEGPEVNENINKRLILARIIFGTILDNLAITGYDAFGLLTDMLHDSYMKVNGRKFILQTIAQVAAAEEEERAKHESYIE